METMLPTVCQSCAGAIPVEYRWLGAPADCPHCLRATIPVMTPGTAYPPTGYELSFGDFLQLLRSGDRSVRRFLADSYRYSLAASTVGPRVMNERQEVVDIAWLHGRIQEDATRRHEIYAMAMSLWR